ncbi:blastula protease 10-like [Palaemon carinicauda]|uniref:blastula protease 10-like n=1 Tax=Palaemon carinicauda TaxID=392227 RepID=UPI0035B5FC56
MVLRVLLLVSSLFQFTLEQEVTETPLPPNPDDDILPGIRVVGPEEEPDYDYLADLPDFPKNMSNFGGIALTQDTYRALFVRRSPLSKDLLWTADKSYYMPEVPYGFTASGSEHREFFREALKVWERGTCVTFRPYLEGRDPHILGFAIENTCSVHLGKQKTHLQYLIISDECSSKEDIVRSIGVTLGFLHQRLRSDRDDYITINDPAIQPDKKHLFQKVSNLSYVTYGIPFDYTSIMQNPSQIYSKDGTPTMIAKDIQYQGLIGRSKGELSFYDKKLVNTHYRCISRWMKDCNIHEGKCQNGGYIGSDCHCVCPSGTGGSDCQEVREDYYKSKLPSCNLEITEPTRVWTPGFPFSMKPGTWCVYQINAPEGNTITLNFTKFHFEQSAPNCTEASLTTMAGNSIESICELAEDSELTYPSPLVLYLDVRNSGSNGFIVDIKFSEQTSKSTRNNSSLLSIIAILFTYLFMASLVE